MGPSGTGGDHGAVGPPPAVTGFGAGFGRVFFARHGLSIPLPDPDAWQMRRERSSFLVLDHVATSSVLVVRTWREGDNVSRDDCERQARLLRDLPSREGAEPVTRERIDVPPGFDTVVEVGLRRSSEPAVVRGQLLAFGGWARRCFAYVLTTEAAGPEAEDVVAERLALMHGRSLGDLELRSDTDPLGRGR